MMQIDTIEQTSPSPTLRGDEHGSEDDGDEDHCIQSLEREFQQVRQHIKLLVQKKARLLREINKHRTTSTREEEISNNKTQHFFPLFSILPNEVILHIFSYFNAPQLCLSIATVCGMFCAIALDESLWAPLYYLNWGSHKVNRRDKGFGWRILYAKQSHTEYNWWKGRSRVETLEGHKGAVRCMQFSGNTLITGSADKTIKIWDLNDDHKCSETLHDTKWVRCLRYDDPSSTLVTIGMDSTQVKVWSLKSNTVAHVLEVHRGWVTCMQMSAPRLVTGSLDGVIRVWDLAACNGQPYHIVHSGHDSLRSIWLSGDLIMSAGVERNIQLWDLRAKSTATPAATIEGATHGNYCVQFDMYAHTVASGSNGMVAIGDIRAAKHPPVLLKGHTDVVSCLQFFGRKLVTGSMDHTIRVWDLNTRQCANTLHGHESWVWDLQFDHDKIVTGSGDKTVKLWAFDYSYDHEIVSL